MGKYRPYPEYKDSGVEWLGEVPSHWGVLGGKRVFGQRRESAFSKDQQLAASQKHGVLPQRSLMEMNGQRVVQALKGTESFRHVEVGDFIISLRSFEGGVEYSRYSGCVSPAYTVLKPVKQITPAFYRLLLKSNPFICALQASTDSLRDGKAIPFDQFGKLLLPWPSKDEQTQIAAFLDRETAKIDRLIEKQETLIELLKEKRQAVISHAVTKGLDPDAPMKDSGVEWLGEIPAHWEVKRIKHLTTSFEQGWSPQCEARQPTKGEWGVLKVGCVNGGTFNPYESKCLPSHLSPKKEYLIKAGDLLISRANSRELVGSAAVVDEDHQNLLLCDKLYRLQLSAEVLPSWISYLLGTRVMRGEIEIDSTGASQSMQNIGQDTIKELPCPIPPYDEQNAILGFLKKRLMTFDKGINKATEAVQLLQERRNALISAAVTGKIDVREEV